MKSRESLTKIADIVDAKGLHMLADKIDSIANELICSDEIQSDDSLSELNVMVDRFEQEREELFQIADKLDDLGLMKIADKLDAALELEVLAEQEALDNVLDFYKAVHTMASPQKIRDFCKSGQIIQEVPDLRLRSVEDIKQEKQEIKEEVKKQEGPGLFRGSPIYPRLFQGFSSINLDRSYYQYHDFSYYSYYG